MREHRIEYVVQRRFLGTREPCESWDDWEVFDNRGKAVDEKVHLESLPHMASDREYRVVMRDIVETVL